MYLDVYVCTCVCCMLNQRASAMCAQTHSKCTHDHYVCDNNNNSLVLKEGNRILNTLHAKSWFARTFDVVKDKFQSIIDTEQLEMNSVKPVWSFSIGSSTFKFSYLSKLKAFSEYQFEFPRVAALY
jgi:hypothetical protein